AVTWGSPRGGAVQNRWKGTRYAPLPDRPRDARKIHRRAGPGGRKEPHTTPTRSELAQADGPGKGWRHYRPSGRRYFHGDPPHRGPGGRTLHGAITTGTFSVPEKRKNEKPKR